MADRCKGITRRSFLADTGMGFTGLALGALLAGENSAHAATPPNLKAGGRARGAIRGPYFQPKAKSCIWIFMCGGVSHVESFDVKPELNKYAGKSIEDTPYKDALNPDKINKNIVGGNPAHIDRKILMPLQ